VGVAAAVEPAQDVDLVLEGVWISSAEPLDCERRVCFVPLRRLVNNNCPYRVISN